MNQRFQTLGSHAVSRVRSMFPARDFLFHDGRKARRISISGQGQAAVAAALAVTVGFSGYGLVAATGAAAMPDRDAEILRMERQVAAMQARVSTIQQVAQAHARRVEQRQALIATALTGTGDARDLAMATLAIAPVGDRVTADVVAPFTTLERRQAALAGEAKQVLDRRYAETSRNLRRLGLRPERVRMRYAPAMGGPLIPAGSAEAGADIQADQQFRALFQSWKKLDSLEQGTIAIPSVQPVANMAFTSNFGIRSDPFRGTAAMHAGVDIPGPVGTPIYATADGVISHSGRSGGYGNLVEINHGKGITTRYGHLSQIMLGENVRVKRGQIIGLMGSTGRSTGPHLHYEVRIDGHAVNPVPFLQTADYFLAAQDRAVRVIPVSQLASQD